MIWTMIGFSLVQCGKDEDKVTGPNTLEDVIIENDDPVLLADGVSTANLIAVVNDTSGYPVSGIRVYFSTTHGSITASAVTNVWGEAYGVLTSAASTVDMDVTVTTTLLDSASLNKKSSLPYKVALKTSDSKKLSKTSTDDSGVTTVLNFQFVGIQFSAVLDASEISADGINSSELKIVVKQTTTKKAVPGAYVYLNALYNSVPQFLITGQDGVSITDIVSMPEAVSDTIFVNYGGFESVTLPLTYILPTLELMPKEAQISAGGHSELIMTARLLSHQNNPIIGAEVIFTTTDGSITAKAYTSTRGDAQATLVSGSDENDNVKVIATFNTLKDSAQVSFIETTGQSLFKLTGEQSIIRNGLETTQIQAQILDDQQNPVTNTQIKFHTIYGDIDTVAVTNELGIAKVTYKTDADSIDANEIVTATFGNKTAQLPIELLGVLMQVSANPDSIQADGISSTQVSVQLKLSTSRQVLSGQTINFNSTLGSIQSSVETNAVGAASVKLTSETQSGIAQVSVIYGGMVRTIPIIFASEKPTTILLTADPNFIWVKETGNLEQTTLIAQVLSQTGSPVSSDISVRFRVLGGPGGGEEIFPAEFGSSTVSVPIKTVNGEARATLKAGTRSGTVLVQAEVISDEYDIQARTTNIVIRSGPPYMWIDPNDPNHTESHMSLAFDYLNLDGWNSVREFQVTVYVGDRYNNPVEEGTTVYLTTTAGIISTDIQTDNMGIGVARLITANPKPVLNPSDPYVLAPHRIPNPNEKSQMLPITVPDFENSQVMNTMGNLGENDGIAYVLATTRGCDQFYHETDDSDSSVTVFSYGSVIFSGPLLVFDVTTDSNELGWGQVATLDIQVYDINGNPVAMGSKLTASTSKGKLSATKLMADADRYGTGTTQFRTYLLNNLDPVEDEAGTAEVTFTLDSPNGTASATLFINLTFAGYGEE